MSIKKILISQETPMNVAPYETIKEKFGVQIDFMPFFSYRAFDIERIQSAENQYT